MADPIKHLPPRPDGDDIIKRGATLWWAGIVAVFLVLGTLGQFQTPLAGLRDQLDGIGLMGTVILWAFVTSWLAAAFVFCAGAFYDLRVHRRARDVKEFLDATELLLAARERECGKRESQCRADEEALLSQASARQALLNEDTALGGQSGDGLVPCAMVDDQLSVWVMRGSGSLHGTIRINNPHPFDMKVRFIWIDQISVRGRNAVVEALPVDIAEHELYSNASHLAVLSVAVSESVKAGDVATLRLKIGVTRHGLLWAEKICHVRDVKVIDAPTQEGLRADRH